ncbi:hypothetical protein SeMB42_g06556 [Synchytrium endobioticum]|uniref:PWWP domain-containing protein n=1 Tax=Synchytrium endobioticum TaxID=286115 RepID=A0A507CCV5_9FUNG|nr:hypothetical protein SeMB42_g06556 [Synchytrium endobioticum]TPX51722.1 hypothetical protein SeLEV6574_g00162 [Synchytrium endobioticum]
MSPSGGSCHFTGPYLIPQRVPMDELMKDTKTEANGTTVAMAVDDINHNDEHSAAHGAMDDDTSHQHEADTTINNDDDEMDADADVADTSMLSFNDSVDTLPALAGPDVKRRVAWTRMKGYPWWPSLVMDAELEAALPIHIRKQKRGKDYLSCYHFGPDGDVGWYKSSDPQSFREFDAHKDEILSKKPKGKPWSQALEQAQRADALTLFDHRWDPVKIHLKVPSEPKKAKKPKSDKPDRRASTGSTKKQRDEEEEEDEFAVSASERRASEPPKAKKSRKARDVDDAYDEAAEPPKKKKKSDPSKVKEEESPKPSAKEAEEDEHERMMKLRAKLQKFWQKIDRNEPLDDKDISKADSALKAVENFHEDGHMPAVSLIKNTKIGKVIKYLSKCKEKVKEDPQNVIARSIRLMDKWQAFYATDTDKGKTVVATSGTPTPSNGDSGVIPISDVTDVPVPSTNDSTLEGDSAQSLIAAESS